MKNLKKTLSLVLVAVMMLGILTIGAGAAFTDQADVDYTEAVDVLSAVGVLAGFEDGSFKPDEILTREQAAKIIAYIMIGKSAADALTTSTAPFTDVPASRWSAGYIAFCVSQGIINGYGDGTFGPADTLTGFQFAKMLLCALGYGKNDEFVGSNWTIEVAKLAIPLGIFSGNVEGASNSPCTREAAALYAFNAMTKCMTVNYSDILGTYYSGTNAFGNPDFDFDYTLAAQVYGLSREPAAVGGRTGYYWLADKDRITGFYSADTIIATSGSGASIKDLLDKTSMFFLAEADSDYDVYYNGVLLQKVKDMSGTVAVTPNKLYFDAVAQVIRQDNGDGKAAVEEDIWGNKISGDGRHAIVKGATVELIDTQRDEGKKIDVVNVIEKTVTRVFADVVSSFGYVRFNGKDYAQDKITGYEGLKKGDIVLTVEIDGVLHITKCNTITGKLEGTGTSFGSAYYVINGKQYSISALPGMTPGFDITNYDTELVFYLDDFNYVVASSTDLSAVTVYYGLVLDAAGAPFSPITGTGAYAKAQVLTQTGETVVYDLINAYGTPDIAKANTLGQGTLISYKMAGENRISDVTKATDADAITNVDYTKGSNQLAGKYLNSSTYFFYYVPENVSTGDPAKYSVAQGYASVPTILPAEAVKGYYIAVGNMAKAVLFKGKEAGGVVDVVYVATADYTSGKLAGSNTTYYEYSLCYRNGVAEPMRFSHKLPLIAIWVPDGAFKVVKDPITGLYSATQLTSSETAPLVYADESYFVGPTSGSTYEITSTSKVYRVTKTVLGVVVSVEPTKLVAPTSTTDVKVVALDATEVTPGYWTVNALYYIVEEK